jgi:hypothetical protein
MSKVTWIPIEKSLPDVDTNVLLGLDDGFSCEGFLDGEQWRDVLALPMDCVVAWADMPRCEL